MHQPPPPPAGWAPPVPVGPAPGVFYAGSGQRLIAYIVDGLVVGLIIWAFYIVGFLVLAGAMASQSGGVGAIGVLFLLVGVLVGVVWKPYWWSHGGQTPAYRMLHIRVVRENDGGPLGLGQAFLRLIGYIVSGIFYLGFIWILIDSRHQGFHDKIASTVVITS